MVAYQLCASQQWSFALTSASDNTPTEAGLDRLWSTAEPLGSFLKLAAAWAAPRTHIAGEKNTWADALSRGKRTAFDNRPKQRHRIKLEQFLDATGCVTLRPPTAAWADQPACWKTAVSSAQLAQSTAQRAQDVSVECVLHLS